MRDVIQCLWIGPRLSTMERTSIASFLRHGHEVHLYTYGDVDGIPPGTVVRDGREILPTERIFTYSDHASPAGFANAFRYKLLLERGGWWVDTDMVCVKPFAFAGEHVFASELSLGAPAVTNSAIKAPRGSEAMAWLCDVCDASDPATLRWGQTGPKLVQQLVERFGMHDAVQPPEVFCPIPFPQWRRLLDGDDPAELPAASHAVHLWNEMWRRENCDKDAAYDPRCLYEILKRGVSAATPREPRRAASTPDPCRA
ncbi:MAG TPA: glycosyltransferase [Thermoanaerobaculia bacterium]|nr:glycosyltransferase [Thermoanaerobaculia bacterium]